MSSSRNSHAEGSSQRNSPAARSSAGRRNGSAPQSARDSPSQQLLGEASRSQPTTTVPTTPSRMLTLDEFRQQNDRILRRLGVPPLNRTPRSPSGSGSPEVPASPNTGITLSLGALRFGSSRDRP